MTQKSMLLHVDLNQGALYVNWIELWAGRPMQGLFKAHSHKQLDFNSLFFYLKKKAICLAHNPP